MSKTIKKALWLPIFILVFLLAAATAEANTYSINDNFESPATLDNCGWTVTGNPSASLAAVTDGGNNANNHALSIVHTAKGSFIAQKTLPTAITSGDATISFDIQRSVQVADYFYVYNSDGSENFHILIQGSNGKGFNISAPSATRESDDVTEFRDSAGNAIQSVFGVNDQIPDTWIHLLLNVDMTNHDVRVYASIGNDLTPKPVKLMTSTGELADDTYLLHSTSSIGSIAFKSTANAAHVFNIDNVQVYTPAGLSLSGPSPVFIPASDTATYPYASAYMSDTGAVDNSPAVTWSIIPEDVTGVSIDSNGMLSVDSTASPGTVTVQAALNADPSVTAAKTVAISASGNATTTYMAFSYNKADASTNIPITLTPNGNTLLSLLNGSTPLHPNTDYTFENNVLTLSQAYLDSFPSGTYMTLTLHMSGGADPTLTVSILDPEAPLPVASISNAKATVNMASGQIELTGNISSGSGVQVTARGMNPSGRLDYANQTATTTPSGDISFRYQPASLTAGTYSFALGGAQAASVALQVYAPSIDWAGMSLSGLNPGTVYNSVYSSVSSSVYADAAGNLAIPTAWFGQTVTLTQVVDPTIGSSAAVIMTIPARAPAPAVSSVNETTAGRKDGKILNTLPGMEYSADNGATWIPVTSTEVDQLAAGTYLVRVAARSAAGSEAFPSLEAIVTIQSKVHPTWFNVTLTQGAGGTALAAPASAAAGRPITLVAIPSKGYTFASWNITPAVTWKLGGANTRIAAFVMPSADITVTPVFIRTQQHPGPKD